MRRLQHVADVRVEPQLASLPRVASVNEHLPARRLVEPADEVHKRRFARAGLADDGDPSPLRNLQVEVLKHVFFSVRVSERHVAERNIPAKRLPVFFPRLERIAVFGRHLRRVAHVGLRVHERRNALNVDLHIHKVRKYLHQPLDGLHHALRVVHEHRKRTDEHDAAHREDTALPQDNRQSRRGRERRCGHEKAPEMHLPHALALHFSREPPELLLHFFFDHKRLRCLRARDALVEAGGDL